MEPIVLSPEPGSRMVRFVGDAVAFSISSGAVASPAHGWQARLRTTLGRGATARDEIIRAGITRVPAFGARWHDIPLCWDGRQWIRELVLAEPGYHAAKPYLIDPRGYQHWPHGPDAGLSIHPDWTRTANTLYCAFIRLFGEARTATRLLPDEHEPLLRDLESKGYATLPPSGTFRDLTRQLPHIVQRLGCRILHLLPVHPTPTTFARFGRFGSPYAALDLTAVDPALVEFDHRTTGIQQFEELTRAAHQVGARVFLDIVINHTGWGSRLYEEHPEHFRREPDGRFASPGAWGVTWEDLVELEQHDSSLWEILAESLLTWCRRGVDGFRCDAGYKVPTHVWQYIAARIHAEFPDTVLLLEGLGGPWESTENLLTDGGMQWAYSELFQNESSEQIQWYLDYALRQSQRVGTYVHYSETHDNNRLASRGKHWSLLRNRLCALTSVRGGFGFTCGVEWLAAEKILVHQRTGLAWNSPSHLVEELASLNHLLARHPSFFDGAELTRISPPSAPVYALLRVSADRHWRSLVLINPSTDHPASIALQSSDLGSPAPFGFELLGQTPPRLEVGPEIVTLHLPAAGAYCLSNQPAPPDSLGDDYRARRARIAWAVQAVAALIPPEWIASPLPDSIADQVAENPAHWLAILSEAVAHRAKTPASPLDLSQAFSTWSNITPFPNVLVWRAEHASRITVIPPGWWLLIQNPQPFQAHLQLGTARIEHHVASIPVKDGHVAAFPPRFPDSVTEATLRLDRLTAVAPLLSAQLSFLPKLSRNEPPPSRPQPDDLVLLTNQRGGMSRLRVDFGSVRSKYDAALAANLHPSLPVDRHVLVKRVRAWLNADGFISPLDRHNLVRFEEGPPARWTFRANAGDGRFVVIVLEAVMPPLRNTVLLRFQRTLEGPPLSARLTLRADIEDRSFHAETRRNPGADHHFASHSRTLPDRAGFEFTPAGDRRLSVTASRGTYHPQPEWSEHISHAIEISRGQVGEGDAFSPGWFEVPLAPSDDVILTLDAEPHAAPRDAASTAFTDAALALRRASDRVPGCHADTLALRLSLATEAFVARRDSGRTVIAGYPWFLDWGRDTLIAARGLLASGWPQEVDEILQVFGRFAEKGTLPNSIFGDNASNRDTSDAALWYIRVVEEATALRGVEMLGRPIHPGGPTLLDVARGIVEGHLAGTPNGIRVDPDSALVWSPAHFTWMDTNHPAGTPREGYPVEIQTLWINALRFLARVDVGAESRWESLANQAAKSFHQFFWIEERGWFADVLLAPPGQPASRAVRDSALRCNMLLPATLGLATTTQARRCVDAALRHLLVPGALRSLAPLPTDPPLPIRSADGRLLNDPRNPYWGRYDGDEDSRRKPAYHNGTAWTWFLPSLCEALVIAWNHRPEARQAARAILGSMAPLLDAGCIGQIPEILDGDAPHTQRGCDAQAWSVTECLRVWLALRPGSEPGKPRT